MIVLHKVELKTLVHKILHAHLQLDSDKQLPLYKLPIRNEIIFII